MTASAMPSWRILADDLTGALDSGAAFCGAAQVPVLLKTPMSSQNVCPASPVQAVVTGSRDLPAASLPAMLQDSLPWFTRNGGERVLSFKKVDSLLRGNTFAEVAWLARSGLFDGVVFAPALPAQGRFTEAGRHWVGPPHQASAAQSAPALDLLAAFAAVGLNARLLADLGPSLDGACGVLIPDVVDDAGLDRLAALSSTQPETARRWLWCGSAGLAWALARHWKLAPTAASVTAPAAGSGNPCFVTASRHPVLRQQLALLAPACDTRQLLLGQPLTPNTAPDPRPLLLDLASPRPLSPVQARVQLMQQAHGIVHALSRPSALVVVGGDTLLALSQASGAHSLAASASPREGWGLARFNGGLWDGVSCYSRSGAFGAPDDLSSLFETLTPKEHTS